MKFAEFKENIEAVFNGKFNQSFCKCIIFKCLGKSITIDCLLGENEHEWINGISGNDMMRTSFMIYLPDNWNDDDELPSELVMKSLKNSIRVKPEDKMFYCDNRKISYRKTKGDAEKMIKAFSKYVDKLHEAIVEEYRADNLLDFDHELIKNKRYAA